MMSCRLLRMTPVDVNVYPLVRFSFVGSSVYPCLIGRNAPLVLR